MATMADLQAFHEIAQLKYRYMRGIDTHDWPLLESCFTDDVVLWPSDGNYIARGRDKVVELLQLVINEGFVSSHTVSQPEISLIAADRAHGIWRLMDVVHYTQPNPAITHIGVQGGEELHGAGYYHDDYVRLADGWKIKSSGYIRIYEYVRRRGQIDVELSVNPGRGMRKKT